MYFTCYVVLCCLPHLSLRHPLSSLLHILSYPDCFYECLRSCKIFDFVRNLFHLWMRVNSDYSFRDKKLRFLDFSHSIIIIHLYFSISLGRMSNKLKKHFLKTEIEFLFITLNYLQYSMKYFKITKVCLNILRKYF